MRNLLSATSSKAALAVSALCLASPAFARTSHVADGNTAPGPAVATSAAEAPRAPAAAAAPQDTGLDDIIVVAQKRAENIQSVPVSIIAVSGDDLVRAGINNLNELQHLAPGLTIASVGSGFVSYTYIRGGGTNQIDAGSDPSVAYFVDESYIGGTAGLQFDMFDVDHVEVLKGPQGTIFGRNAASGAISIITKRPTTTFQGDVYLEAGNYGARLIKANVSGPLNASESLLFRASGFYRHQDPVTRNLTGKGDPGKIDVGGARGQLQWKGENVSLLLTGDVLSARNGMTNQFLSTANVGGFVDPTLPQPTDQSFFSHYYDVVGFEHQDLVDLSARLDWQTSLGTVTALSSYRHNVFTRLQDQDGSIYDGLTLGSRERDRTFSQELRLTGDAMNKLHYIVGLYYYNGNITEDFNYHAGVNFAAPTLRNTTLVDKSLLTTKSYSAFGQATYDLTDKLHLTLGGRYTNDKKEDARNVAYFVGAPFSVDPRNSWNAFTPTATLNFKPTQDVMLYASYRKGFKSGGYQTLGVSNATAANTPFNPENVASYEVGLKSSFFDHHVTADIALFRSDITNQQVSQALSVTNVIITNAGKTRTDGVDFTLRVRPVQALTFSASGTYQHARFREYLSPPNDYAGKSQLRSPDFTLDLMAEYNVNLGSVGTITLAGELFHSSPVFYDLLNSRVNGLYQPGYNVGNLHVTVKPSNMPLELSAYVKNVGDTHYFQNIAGTAATGALGVPAMPRTFGFSLLYRFGR
jgi:iron complex outermembrane receptor protein